MGSRTTPASLVVVLLFAACDGSQSGGSTAQPSAIDLRYEAQLAEGERQAAEGAKQLTVMEEQGRRYDQLLQVWQRQNEDIDRLIDGWEAALERVNRLLDGIEARQIPAP